MPTEEIVIEAYSVQAAAEAIGTTVALVYRCLEDGRLQKAMLKAGDTKLVSASSVDAYRDNPRALLKPRGPVSTWLDRIEHVEAKLASGATYGEIGNEFGVSRQRIEQVVRRLQTGGDTHPPCRLCGAPVIEGDRRKHLHAECVDEFVRLRNGETKWHQRDRLNEYEALALDEYERRGYAVSWVPHQAAFDWWVNGRRVDVKGSRIHNDQGFDWIFRPSGNIHNHDLYADLTSRCDIYHCIGIDDDGTRYDLLLTSDEAGDRFRLHLTPPPRATNTPRNLKYRDRWELLEDDEEAQAR